jgi:acyl-CoA thioesterase
MSQRVQQIFGFYKWRCRNQSVLSHAERQLSSKLNILITEHPLNPAKVMAYVVEISRKGFSFNGRHVNQAQKSSLIYSSSSKLQRKFNCSSETK